MGSNTQTAGYASTSDPDRTVALLEDAVSLGRDVIGGKGWGLARLVGAGFNVPRGFVICSSVFRAFLDSTGLRGEIVRMEQVLAKSLDYDSLHAHIGRLTETIEGAPIAEDIAQAIIRTYRSLGAPFVAVRSSAASEDSASASFAGQHRSFMNVEEANLLRTVKACWLSAWTAEAIQYRRSRGLGETDVGMAVVVQRMVSARVSGVAFSVDVLRQDAGVMVINVVRGLGESLVGGSASPNEIRLSKERRRFGIFRKRVNSPLVTGGELEKLRRTVVAIEALFGTPQDIEFAFEGDDLLILQARPISSLPDFGVVPDGTWTRSGFSEWLQRPVSPLFATVVLPALSEAADDMMMQRWRVRRPSPTWAIVKSFYFTRAAVKVNFAFAMLPWRFIRDTGAALAEWKAFVEHYEAERTKLAASQPSGRDLPALQTHFEQSLALASQCWAWVIVTGALAKASATVASGLARRLGLSDSDALALLSGFENKSVEADEELWRLTEVARGDDALANVLRDVPSDKVLAQLAGTPWASAFQGWIESWGSRVFDLDLVEETLEDRPEFAIDVIKSYLINDKARSPKARVESAAERRAAAEHALHKALQSRSRLTARFARSVMTVAAGYAQIREDRPFYLHRLWPLLRRDLRAFGDRLVSSGLLENRDDVFFLEKDELRSALRLNGSAPRQENGSLANAARERRERRTRNVVLRPETTVSSSALVRWLIRPRRAKAPAGGNTVLVGVPGSAGHASGPARVIRTESEFGRLQSGEILVARYTTTAWTPLLSLAAAIVTEVGGSLAHAAIIAREYGIPAVLGVHGLLERIQDGMQLEVDGGTGTVTILASAGKGDSDVAAAEDGSRTV